MSAFPTTEVPTLAPRGWPTLSPAYSAVFVPDLAPLTEILSPSRSSLTTAMLVGYLCGAFCAFGIILNLIKRFGIMKCVPVELRVASGSPKRLEIGRFIENPMVSWNVPSSRKAAYIFEGENANGQRENKEAPLPGFQMSSML
jgi:hypothetical protein